MEKFKLGILDQSIIRHGSNAREAIEETMETVQLAERLGYERFWISEHHNSKAIAGTTPEVLMVKLASLTDTIRIGSGGIMLPNHSAYKVAENFRMLEVLFPGRIDLGMGRAPGTDRITSSLLNPSVENAAAIYPKQIMNLQHFFNDTASTQYGPVIAAPQSETIPQQWILSSSGGSSELAAEYGMGLSVAKFINGYVDPFIVQSYRQHFRPSEAFPEPKVMVSVFTLCGETEEIAATMRKYQDFIFLQFEKGGRGEFRPDPEYVAQYRFSDLELERIEMNKERVVSGTPEQVAGALKKIARDFEADEIMVSTMGDSKSHRLRSFELIAEQLID